MPLAVAAAVVGAASKASGGGASTPVSADFLRSDLPSYLNGLVQCSTGAIYRDSLWTHGDKQYGIWIDANNRSVIGQRTLPDGAWSTYDLRGAAGDPFGATNTDHCAFAVAVDAAGYIHVAGNMHTDTLRYAVSDSPNSIQGFSAASMVGSQESSVTYPSFTRAADGSLLFWYRDGSSGDARIILNQYDAGTSAWSRVATVIDGLSTGKGVYYAQPRVDPATGTLHLFWTWRDTSIADTTHDLCYAKSTDNGTTWTQSDGTAYSLPITFSAAERVEDTALSGSGLLSVGVNVDATGRPHAVYSLYDGSGYMQFWQAYFDGSWLKRQVTSNTTTMSTDSGFVDWTVSAPVVLTDSSGNVYVVYRNSLEHRGQIRVMDITPGQTVVDALLLPFEVGISQFPYDTQALRERQEFHTLISSAFDPTIETIGYPASWPLQDAFVATIALDKFPGIISGVEAWPETLASLNIAFTGTPTQTQTASTPVTQNGLLRATQPGVATVGTAPTSATVFAAYRKRGGDRTLLGSVAFGPGETTGKISLMRSVALDAGDAVELECLTPTDATFSNLTWAAELVGIVWPEPTLAALPQDDFTDADSTSIETHTMTVGSGWDLRAGTLTIQGNELQSGASGENYAVTEVGVHAYTLHARCYPGASLIVRYQSDTSLMHVNLNLAGQKVEIVHRTTNDTALASQAETLVADTYYDVEVIVTPDSITATVNGGDPLTWVGTTNSMSTVAGVRIFNNNRRIDSFLVVA